MKKLMFVLVGLLFGVILQLNFRTTVNNGDVQLGQLMLKAEASCIEIGGESYKCCPMPWMICYLGGGANLWLSEYTAMYSM